MVKFIFVIYLKKNKMRIKWHGKKCHFKIYAIAKNTSFWDKWTRGRVQLPTFIFCLLFSYFVFIDWLLQTTWHYLPNNLRKLIVSALKTYVNNSFPLYIYLALRQPWVSEPVEFKIRDSSNQRITIKFYTKWFVQTIYFIRLVSQLVYPYMLCTMQIRNCLTLQFLYKLVYAHINNL